MPVVGLNEILQPRAFAGVTEADRAANVQIAELNERIAILPNPGPSKSISARAITIPPGLKQIAEVQDYLNREVATPEYQFTSCETTYDESLGIALVNVAATKTRAYLDRRVEAGLKSSISFSIQPQSGVVLQANRVPSRILNPYVIGLRPHGSKDSRVNVLRQGREDLGMLMFCCTRREAQ